MSEWKKIILSKEIGLRHGYQFRETDFTENGVPVVKIGNVTEAGLDLGVNASFVSPKRINEFENIIIKDGDILMSLTGNIGRVVEVKNTGNKVLFQNYRVGVFYPLTNNIYKPYIKWILNSSEILMQLNSYSNQSAQANFGKQDMDKLKFSIPIVPEQRQITKILSTADAVIEKTQATIDKYKAIKQGMLHDLFTRGIEISTGKLRPKYEEAPELYKESKLGMIPEEWEVEKLGDYSFVTKLAGFEYTLYFDYSKSGPIIAVRALNIKQGKLTLDHIHTIPKETADLLPRSQLQKGDLVISYVGTVGEVAVIPENNRFHLAPNVAKISVEKKYINPFFLNQFLNSDIGQNEIIKLVSSTTQAALSMQNLREVKFLRLNLTEQKEISKRLENIDNNIETEQNYLLKLQQLKTGLMSDLLSGKKRVKI